MSTWNVWPVRGEQMFFFFALLMFSNRDRFFRNVQPLWCLFIFLQSSTMSGFCKRHFPSLSEKFKSFLSEIIFVDEYLKTWPWIKINNLIIIPVWARGAFVLLWFNNERTTHVTTSGHSNLLFLFLQLKKLLPLSWPWLCRSCYGKR